jgi:hypothetical protein
LSLFARPALHSPRRQYATRREPPAASAPAVVTDCHAGGGRVLLDPLGCQSVRRPDHNPLAVRLALTDRARSASDPVGRLAGFEPSQPAPFARR